MYWGILLSSSYANKLKELESDNPIGAGKTAFAVRQLYKSAKNRPCFSNIEVDIPNVSLLKSDMIIKRDIVDYKKKRSGESEAVYKYSLNLEFWKNIGACDVVLDEAHSILNARKSMSKTNVIVSDWLSLIRRVVGGAGESSGKLTLISQLHNRIDIIAREMATNVIYLICHYYKGCLRCNGVWMENSEQPEPADKCFRCGSYEIEKFNHTIEAWHFKNMNSYQAWFFWGQNSFYKHYFVNDIEDYFPLYSTYQWSNMFMENY